jgi:hypothetical protein
MSDIKPVVSYGILADQDLRSTLNGLNVGARYRSSDLYSRYSEIATGAGRNPAHPVAVGQGWNRLGLKRCKTTIGGPGAGKGRSGRGTQVIAWEIPFGF